MPAPEPLQPDAPTPPPHGVGVYDRPSWLRAHVVSVSIVTAVTLALFALFAIHR